MQAIEFREATEKDYAGICGLIRSEEELFRVYPAGNYPFSIDQVRALSRVRKELTVALEGMRIVGFANLYDYEKGTAAFIGNVFVDRMRRGVGLGKSLVLHMLNLSFGKHELGKVRISVFSDNSPALLLYAGLGFTPYAIEERRDPHQNRVALVHMVMGREHHATRSSAACEPST